MTQLSLAAVDEAAPPADTTLSQWFTPSWLAKRMVEWAGVRPGMRVLEPSCGNGRIVDAILDAGADVCGYEIDERFLPSLRPAIARGACIHRGDFRTAEQWSCCLSTRYDLSVMNPPYENGLDVEFIVGAIQWTPRVVALVRTTTFHGVERRRDLWENVSVRRIVFLERRPDFGGEHGAKTDFVVLDLTERRGPGLDCPTVEWW